LDLTEKKKALLSHIKDLMSEDCLLAFSGGVDSSLLLKLCCDVAASTGRRIYAVTIHTKLHPKGDLAIAKKVAQEAGAFHQVLYIDELEEAGIRFNPVDRCYLCKKSLFQKLIHKAEELKIRTIIEGTNEDDLHVYRPGIRALKELGILSPLAMMGINKKEVRELAAEYGISVADRPGAPCMATRFPYGTELNYDFIEKVEKAEDFIRELGFYNVRLRVHGNIARIETDECSMPDLLEKKDIVIPELKKYGFDYITMDLDGFRSGSMDIHLSKDSD